MGAISRGTPCISLIADNRNKITVTFYFFKDYHRLCQYQAYIIFNKRNTHFEILYQFFIESQIIYNLRVLINEYS